ncbi:protein pcc13-62 [Citrus sinensis]|uniref:Protein pcc13-62 n=1 Tax=Citrus sinensis TaxID=2711 RepID=A0ACB8ML62_CITSI|nr:protein pcc13-62 [Citrus sinensis]KAH9786337.1 protein pcc13-62 [Citrus sinensis]
MLRLDCIASWLAEGGPPTTRARKASLDDLTNRTIEKLGYQEGGSGAELSLCSAPDQWSAIAWDPHKLVAELLGVESGEDAVLPTLLYERTYENVLPYNITVVEFTIYVSDLRNQVAMFGIKDKGLIVPPQLGAESRTESNTLSADAKFLVVYANPAGDFKDCLWNWQLTRGRWIFSRMVAMGGMQESFQDLNL